MDRVFVQQLNINYALASRIKFNQAVVNSDEDKSDAIK
jgi:hypothetical protein